MATQRQRLGTYGEHLAAQHLVRAGMVLLDRNWRGVGGELDLVLRDGNTLVVCEVKTRSSAAFGSPLEGVTAAKAARLRRLAGEWMEVHRLRIPDVRIDLVGVLRTAEGLEIDHVSGVC
jgi:putative endonuclease